MSNYDVNYILKLKDRFSGQLKGIQGQMQKFDSALTSINDIVLGGGAIAGLGLLANKIKDTTVEFQRYQTMLNTSFGSDEAANAAFKGITDFASKTPYAVGELTDSFIRLKNRGFEPTTEEMTKMGDLAASQGKSFIQLTEAILDAQTGEFERLKEFGIKANKEGDRVKIAFKGVTQEIDFTNEAITETVLGLGAMEGVMGGMEAQSKTLGGQISNLGDSFDQLYYAIGNLATFGGAGSGGILGAIGDRINDNTTLLSNYNKFWKDTDTGVSEKILQTISNTGDVLLANMPFAQMFYDVSPYISSHDAMINRITGARDMFRKLDDTQKEFYSNMLSQEKYNKLWERNAEVMGLSVDKFKEYMEMNKTVSDAVGGGGTLEDLEKQIKQLKEGQKGASSRSEFQKNQTEIDKIQKQIDRITGGKSGSKSGSNATSSTLTSRSPQTFNITITKLVETINTTKPIDKSNASLQKDVTQLFTAAVNDVQQTIK